MEVRKHSDIKKGLIEDFMSSQKKITDFNKGSVADSMFEAMAREEEKKYIATKLGFTQNLKAIPYSLFEFEKKEGTFATSSVVFKRGVAKDFETTIPEGTEVSGGGNSYVTTRAGVIAANNTDSSPIPVKAVAVGSDYNMASHTINKIVSVVSSDVIEVTNNIIVSGGCNEETESEMLARFKDLLAGLQGTSKYGLKSAVENINGVRSVNVVEDFSIGALYPVIVYAEDGSGGLSDETKAKITDVIEGDGTKANPGKRAPGINVLVNKPEIVYVSMSMRVHTYRADPEYAEEEIRRIVTEYVNGLGIGENVVLTTIILLLRSLSFITDVEILSPETNVIIAGDKIARFENLEVDLREE